MSTSLLHGLLGLSCEVVGALGDRAHLPASLHTHDSIQSNKGRNKPVMCIPGLRATDRSLDLPRLRLERQGFRVFPSNLRPWNTGDFSRHADELLSELRTIADQSEEAVGLVGHSMGGRFACYLASEAPELVSNIVTYGTPYGIREITGVASLIASDAVIAEMSHRCHLPESTPLTAIVADADRIVEHSGAILAKDERARHRRQKIVPGSHLRFMTAEEYIQLVVRGLLWKPKQRTVH